MDVKLKLQMSNAVAVFTFIIWIMYTEAGLVLEN